MIDSLKKAADQAEETRARLRKDMMRLRFRNQQFATFKGDAGEGVKLFLIRRKAGSNFRTLKDSLKDYVITAPVSGNGRVAGY